MTPATREGWREMTPKNKKVPTNKHKAGSLPNFEKLTALLNQQEHPRQMLRAIVSLGKPLPQGGNHRFKET